MIGVPTVVNGTFISGDGTYPCMAGCGMGDEVTERFSGSGLGRLDDVVTAADATGGDETVAVLEVLGVEISGV